MIPTLAGATALIHTNQQETGMTTTDDTTAEPIEEDVPWGGPEALDVEPDSPWAGTGMDADVLDDQLDEETSEDKRRAEWLDEAQELIDFLDEHRDLVPVSAISISRYVWSPEELAVTLRALGSCEKTASEYSIGGRRQFGRHEITTTAPRTNTCKKVETGEVESKTETISATETVPANARNVRTITQVVYEIDEPVTEWVCPDSLLKGGDF